MFLQDSVSYLGHRVDANGLHALEDKLDAIMNAPPPRNVQQLRAFLGLLNYGKFMSNLPYNGLFMRSRNLCVFL